MEVGVWRDAGVEVGVWRDVGGVAGVKAVLQHGFMCTVETIKERVLLPDVEKHMRVDVPSILVGNRRMKMGREKGREKGKKKAVYNEREKGASEGEGEGKGMIKGRKGE